MSDVEFATAINMPSQNGEAAMYGDDRSLTVTFYKETILQDLATAEAGHPIYKDFDFISIVTPGGKSDLRRPVKMSDDGGHPPDPKRFPMAWARFQNANTVAQDGFPLEQCPFLPKAEIMGFKAGQVHTVEQLANIPDSALQNFGMMSRKWRDMALAYLARAEGNKDISQLATKYDNLLRDFESLRGQFIALSGAEPKPGEHKAEAAVLALPKRRGPKPKIKTPE